MAERGGNVVDVAHQRAFSKLSVKLADVDFTIETRTGEHAEEIAHALDSAGFAATRLGLGTAFSALDLGLFSLPSADAWCMYLAWLAGVLGWATWRQQEFGPVRVLLVEDNTVDAIAIQRELAGRF
ncbi:MAG: hypothetical protein U1E17_01405 [Geminicoccaceae bacterium]